VTDGDPQPGGAFRVRKRAAAADVQAEQAPAKCNALLDELALIQRRITFIRDRGQEAFMSPRDETLYLAAQTVLVNFQDMVSARLPESVRVDMVDVPWEKIQGIRNRFAHDYRDTQKLIVWETVADEMPALLQRLLANGLITPARWQ